MAFYIIVFVIIGFVIGVVTSKDKECAYIRYLLISIGWFFISGPFAILTLVELGGYAYRENNEAMNCC